MHIPDGFLNVSVAAATYAVAAVGVGYSLRRANKVLGEKHIPLVGTMAAFIFAAQMLNFPVAGGTSGHLVGAALAAILLGPWAGVLIMTAVLIVQSLLFQDGGLSALGANVLNMGIIGSLSGYYVFRVLNLIIGARPRGQTVAAFAGAWVAVLLSSIAASVELAFSGTVPLRVALPAMAGVHALIGVGEGLITVAVLSLVLVARRDLLQLEKV